MTVSQRIDKIHRNLTHNRLTAKPNHHPRPLRVTHKGRVGLREMVAAEKTREHDVCILTNVQPIDRLPKWAQWIVQYIYFRYGWAAMAKDEKTGMLYSVEYRGVTPDESEARYYSSELNASYMKVPWRSCLPIETGQYSTHDFPLSPASHKYRKRELPFVQVPRGQLERLAEKIRATDPIVGEMRAKVV